MDKDKSVEALVMSIKIEGLGYAINDYYGKVKCSEDPKMEELWNNAAEALEKLTGYISEKYPELDEYEY